MDWLIRRWRFSLLALIVTTCFLIYIRSHMEPSSTVTFMRYFSREQVEVINVPPKLTGIPVNLSVVNYTAFPMLDKVECVPLKTAMHQELICLHDASTDSYISNALKRYGVWEPEIFKPLSKLVVACADCQFLDIGSNIGVFAVTLASMGRTVVAVEPLYINLLRLTKSIRLNKMENKVTIVTNPVSNVHENVTLWVPDNNVGGTHVASKGITYGKIGDGHTFLKAPEDVPTIYLDEILPLINFKKAIMKVDIEGYETKAFMRAAKLFDAVEITHVFMEWMGKNNLPLDTIKPLIDFFTNRSYVAHSIDLTVLPSDQEGFRKWPQDIIWVRAR